MRLVMASRCWVERAVCSAPSPVGLLVLACERYTRPLTLSCTKTCGAYEDTSSGYRLWQRDRLDQPDRLQGRDHMPVNINTI